MLEPPPVWPHDRAMRSIFTLLFLTSYAVAHSGHAVQTHVDKQNSTQSSALTEINADYELHVKAIFEEKCASCHSSRSPAPWYAAVPFISGLVNSDRTEAVHHLEISEGFPFGGHGSPSEDLKALRETTVNGTMPPGLYRVVHPLSRLSGDEKAIVLRWLDNGDRLLGK